MMCWYWPFRKLALTQASIENELVVTLTAWAFDKTMDALVPSSVKAWPTIPCEKTTVPRPAALLVPTKSRKSDSPRHHATKPGGDGVQTPTASAATLLVTKPYVFPMTAW